MGIVIPYIELFGKPVVFLTRFESSSVRFVRFLFVSGKYSGENFDEQF
jgi:hypothetical protein